jgi:hypothetical protein
MELAGETTLQLASFIDTLEIQREMSGSVWQESCAICFRQMLAAYSSTVGAGGSKLYKTYLGEYAQGLPASGGRFPLSLRTSQNTVPVVRTVLAVNEDEQSLTFTADMPEGVYARFMKANLDRLVDGAIGAAKTSYEAIGSSSPDLAVLISCIGRKLVLKQRIEEEVEGVRDVLGDRTVFTGFYSYGEISPFTPGARCELHNQTMTITTFSEK